MIVQKSRIILKTLIAGGALALAAGCVTTQQLEEVRAEAAEAKLAVARDALAKIASLGRCDFAEVRATLATLDTDQPAPRDGVTVGETLADVPTSILAAEMLRRWQPANLAQAQHPNSVPFRAALRALTEGGE